MPSVGALALAGLVSALAVGASTAGLAEPILSPIPDSTPLGSGPFKAIPSMDPGLPDHTIYAPPELSSVGGRKLPIVAWGNGACVADGTRFRWFLSEIASQGYLVLANGKMGTPEQQIWRRAAPAPAAGGALPNPAALPPPATRSSQLTQAIDWAIAENARAGSRFFGRIDTSKVAVMGMSCGGVQAIEAGGPDPRVTTTVVWNSGLFSDSRMNAMGGGEALTKAALERLHGSVAYISGDETDIAFANANDDFERLHGVPAVRAYRKGTAHDGTYAEPNGGDFGRIAVAWLNWRLKGDGDAAKLFVGDDCGLCRDPQWVIKQKDLR